MENANVTSGVSLCTRGYKLTLGVLLKVIQML